MRRLSTYVTAKNLEREVHAEANAAPYDRPRTYVIRRAFGDRSFFGLGDTELVEDIVRSNSRGVKISLMVLKISLVLVILES